MRRRRITTMALAVVLVAVAAACQPLEEVQPGSLRDAPELLGLRGDPDTGSSTVTEGVTEEDLDKLTAITDAGTFEEAATAAGFTSEEIAAILDEQAAIFAGQPMPAPVPGTTATEPPIDVEDHQGPDYDEGGSFLVRDLYTVWGHAGAWGPEVQIVFPVATTEVICDNGWEGTAAATAAASVVPFGTVVAAIGGGAMTFNACFAMNAYDHRRCGALAVRYLVFGIPQSYQSRVPRESRRCRFYAG